MPRLASTTCAVIMLTAAATIPGVPAGAVGGVTVDCDTPSPSASLPPHPGALRWGINPRVQAGQIGLQQPAVPSVPGEQLAALAALTGGSANHAGPAPFVVRLNRIFFPVQPGQDAALAADVARYAGAGYLVEFQLRFHPTDLAPNVPDRTGGDPAAFATWAAQLVHRYDTNPALVSVQVVNEANVDYSFDSSDGYYTRAMTAMADGVVAVKHQVILDSQAHVRVGTNWVYRGLPQTDKAFWDTFLNNPAARAALDWMGLDAYPGTFPFPSQPASYHDALAGDIDLLRRCFMAYARIPPSVPIYIEETGWPTAEPLRPQSTQLTALRQLTAAAQDYAGTYNVTDFRWFNLRDADSSSPNFQQHFGLMTSTYARKPAFCAYRAVVTGRPGCPTPGETTAAPDDAVAPLPRAGTPGLPPTSTAFVPMWPIAVVADALVLGLALGTIAAAAARRQRQARGHTARRRK
jgi:hypothetical protein